MGELNTRWCVVAVAVFATGLGASGAEAIRAVRIETLRGDNPAGSQYGVSVALGGGLAVVGAPNETRPGVIGPGSAYVYDALDGDPLETFEPGAFGLGSSVATDGVSVLAGAALDSAAAYYSPNGSEFIRQDVPPLSGVDGTLYGAAVDLDGSRSIVAAPFDSEAGQGAGAAYLADPTTGTFQAKLVASDASQADAFGSSVALDGGLAVVGAPQEDAAALNSGSAYVFDAATGEELRKLIAADGGLGHNLGTSVAISGGLAVVGAPQADGTAGAAYVFDANTGAELLRLSPAGAQTGDAFGTSVAVLSDGFGGGQVLVGAQGVADKAGAAYVFDLATGQQLARLLPETDAPSQRFGASVALAPGRALVGAAQAAEATLFAWGEPTVAGDLDLSGVVDGGDYQLWTQQFGRTGDPATVAWAADVNADGVVDGADYTAWRDAFESPLDGSLGGAGAPIPEPAAGVLGLAALACPWRGRGALHGEPRA